MATFGYVLDRSVGLPCRRYLDNHHTTQTRGLLQHAPPTTNYIFRPGLRVWSMALDPVDHRFLLVGSSQSQLLLYDLQALDDADNLNWAIPEITYNTNNPLEPVCAVGARAEISNASFRGPALQFGLSGVDWYPVDGGLCISSSLDEHVKVWDADAFSCVSTLPLRSKVFGAKFSPVASTHSLIAAATAKGEVRLVDMASGATAHSLLGHKDEVWTLDWAPTNEFHLASGSGDGEIRLWDIRRSGATACLLCLNQEGKAMVPGRSSLYTNVKSEKPMTLIAAASRKRRRTGGASEAHARDRARARARVDSHTERLHASVHHPKRKDPHAAASTSLAVAHNGGVTSLAYTPDGRFLLSNGMDEKLRLWNSATGEHQFMNYQGVRRSQPRAARNVQMAVVQEANAWESTMMFVPNGSQGELASYRVFGENGTPEFCSTAHYEQVTACVYRKTTCELFSAGEDGLIMKWKPPPVDLYPGMSNEISGESHEQNQDSSNIATVALVDEDTWSDDEDDVLPGPGYQFVPPILRDDY
ncbi:DNA excision repair protein ERCC-8 [Phytophthora boehmeriae]|uniref:DNA excision repair protein ERCC-8 n=1 Tax=Phytophthora boehmeriae TaxID=109152 RepID=A0A8T1WKS1_9STRA|nr:DNA excision repair protein ERCC-8 [Phytophthora boehmeriae]